ncbi:protein kinase [Heliobacterium chlorum]|uniref:mitogen-activated protein kinase kinase n=1 Tax=Heliobacterium chlorum TaxID=2698 RepID=A0ABR7T1B4_HELCL|nr:protein kinase [Heliobacterium chlorum]
MFSGKKLTYLKLLITAGRYQAAINTLLPEEDPEEGKLVLALCSLSGDYQTFYDVAERWDKFFEENHDPLWFLLRCHGDIGYKGLHPRSMPIFLAAAAAIPEDPFALWAAAVACSDRNRLDKEAMDFYERALRIDEMSLAQYDPLPLLEQDPVLASFPKICSLLRQVLGRDLWEADRFPPQQELYRTWGERLVTGRLRKDEPDLEDVRWLKDYLEDTLARHGAVTDEVVRIYRYLSNWLLKYQRTDSGALAFLEESTRYLVLRDKIRAEEHLGKTYFNRQIWHKAVYWLQRVTLRQKGHLESQLFYARALSAWQHEQSSNLEYRKVRHDARAAWNKVLQLDPFQGEALLELGEMAEEDGRFKEAREFYRQVLAAVDSMNEKDDRARSLQGRAMVRWGLLCFRGGEMDQAGQLLTKAAAKLVPDNDENRIHLARALFYLGELSRRQEDLFQADQLQRQALTWDPAVGGHLRGEWEQLLKLGQGGFAEVWQVRHRNTGQMGAMKVLKPNCLNSEKGRKRFKNEAALTMAFGGAHNLIQGYPESVDFSRFTFVMELLDGSLKDRIYQYDHQGNIVRRSPLPEAEVRRVLSAVGEALVYLHGFGREFIHRDIKPDNILVDRDLERIRLADLGTLRVPKQLLHNKATFERGETSPKEARWATDYTLIETFGNLGTPTYTAPEVLKSPKGWANSRLDQRADVFSLGVTLFEIATGYLPFTTGHDSEENIQALMDRVMEATFIDPAELELDPDRPGDLSRLRDLHASGRVALPPRALNRDISEKMEAAILRCLEKDPNRRYAAVRHLLTDLELF